MNKRARRIFDVRTWSTICVLLVPFCRDGHVHAHQGHSHLQLVNVTQPPPSNDRSNHSDNSATGQTPLPLGGPSSDAFQVFEKTVSVHTDGTHLIVETNGLPDHGMMVGIRAWQQQVPLPQPFVGDNAWRLPLNPRPASKPISVLTEPLRGAIALAVNGVPIFCALNNRGEDTFLVGELDQWGGHCGRGDDYHYHIAPVHLEKQVGVGNPIAYGLDGYPILGLTDADGVQPSDLDSFNGHSHDGSYHYHATKGFPYINGGLHGEVTMAGDQVDQPKDAPIRPGQSPLRGATITNFTRSGDQFDLRYEISGKPARVKYRLLGEDRIEFTYVSTSGESTTEVYTRGQTRGGLPGGILWWPTLLVIALTGVWLIFRHLSKRHQRSMAGDVIGSD